MLKFFAGAERRILSKGMSFVRLPISISFGEIVAGWY